MPLPYVGGAAPRNTVYKDIHTTNESPPDQPIPFHHEVYFFPSNDVSSDVPSTHLS